MSTLQIFVASSSSFYLYLDYRYEKCKTKMKSKIISIFNRINDDEGVTFTIAFIITRGKLLLLYTNDVLKFIHLCGSNLNKNKLTKNKFSSLY